jgi:hypothetical protein
VYVHREIIVNEDSTALKKYNLKPSDFYKKNIMIINEDKRDNLNFLSDFLYKLSLMKNVNTIYNNDIHVITTVENKKMFKQMLLENPYLYFTNFEVKQHISKKDLTSIKENQNRTIYIIDNNSINDQKEFNIIRELIDNNVHVIIAASDNDDNKQILLLYDALGKEKLLIHKLNKLKTMQKKFHKNFVKPITKSFPKFESFYEMINDQEIDLKYIVIKNNEIQYN